MYKKRMVYLTIAASMVILLLLSGSATAAPKNRPPEPTEGIKSNDPLSASVDVIRDTRSGDVGAQVIYLISRYGCSITNLGNGKVSIAGYTETYNTVSLVSVTLYLQKWDGTKWVDITNQSFSGSSTNSIKGTKDITVTKGAYYRTRASHFAQNGSTTDSTSSTSSYIYVE